MLPRRSNESNYRFEQQQKNLGNQLGGVIFSELHGVGLPVLKCGWFQCSWAPHATLVHAMPCVADACPAVHLYLSVFGDGRV